MDCENTNTNNSKTYGSFIQEEIKQETSNYKIIKQISDSLYPVFMAKREDNKSKVAIKCFPHQKDGRLNENYLREKQLLGSNHKNIVKIIECQDYSSIDHPDFVNSSCVITKYATSGDFIDAIPDNEVAGDDMQARTYFQQLIEGLEYLHNKGIAHLDLKCENILLGNDEQVKIIDFDQSNLIESRKQIGRGTPGYRAPEIITKQCTSLVEADIYSAGIILFFMKFGFAPYREKELIDGQSLHLLLLNDIEGYWKFVQDKYGRFMKIEQDFKTLFESMVNPDYSKRPSIAQIKKSEWYNGLVYDC